MKSKKTLEQFIKYCEDNPEQRFWQALRNFSGFNFIFVAKEVDEKFNPKNPHDTFYFTGLNK